jgi:general L-amino acid transport system permease protein
VEDNALTQEIKPPDTSKGPVRWLRDNLFSTWYNTILTCLGLVFLFLFFKGFLTWVFTQANWRVIPANLQILMIGPFPIEQVWRIGIVFCTLLTLLGLSAGIWRGIVLQMTIAIAGVCLLLLLIPFDVVREAENTSATLEFNLNIFYLIFIKRIWLLVGLVLLVGTLFIGRKKDVLKKWIIGGWILSFPWTMIMLHGFGENTVSTTNWGGLLLTLILAAVGIVACFPIGVLLALGRRSQLPAIRWVSTVYIETIRGVPLITILFMGSLLLPIFMPGDFQLDTVIRAMVALTLFSSAYMAENVRGGLQAIPSGQVEAAQAVGLSYTKTMLFIVLPQAIRAVIPAIVGQSIALLKDTSLVFIIGLIELMGIRKSILGNQEWTGLHAEVSIFIAVIYFVFSYSMSIVSQEIEEDLGVGNN